MAPYGLRYLSDVINDTSVQSIKNKFVEGIKTNKDKKEVKRLKIGKIKSSRLTIRREWQRNISTSQILKYKQFNPQLGTFLVISVRPECYGGDIVLIDGQHRAIMDILGGCDYEHDTLELHHDDSTPLKEIEEKEADLYKELNTNNKKLSKLDIYRVDYYLGEKYAENFNDCLNSCGLNLDGLGKINGTTIAGSGTRMMLTVNEYYKNFSDCIVDAVVFYKNNWGSFTNPLTVVRDDFIYGLTALFAFIEYAGKIEGGTKNGLDKKGDCLKNWMYTVMPITSVRKYVNNSAGGNVSFKVVHNIINEYNFWASENNKGMTISTDYLHQNGIYDQSKYLDKEEKDKLPTFPRDIKF